MEKNTINRQLFNREDYYLTDGGLETTLVFHKGIVLPHFAAFELLEHPEGRSALLEYYQPYLELARKCGLHFILETPTWRANTNWGFKLGYTQGELDKINRQAVQLMRELKLLAHESEKVLISGNIGPAGDGYKAEKILSSSEAKRYHQPQALAFAGAHADFITALTLNYSDEAVGIVLSAEEVSLPVVISFTVETDGRLPSGETLKEAIEKTDRMTGGYTTHFMINCAHPEHFTDVLREDGAWRNRIRGIRANASTKSHAELDESETLDTGDKHLLAEGYTELISLLPDLRIFGGCCGTDHTHLEEICTMIFNDQNKRSAQGTP